MKNILKNSKTVFVIIIAVIMLMLCMGNIIANTTTITLKGVRNSGSTYYDGATYTITTDSNNKTKITITYVNGRGKTVTEDTTNIYFDNSPSNNLFKENDIVYCVQHGENIADSYPKYSLSDVYIVNDPILAYILNIEDKSSTTNIKENLKQNMIWWYLNEYPNTDEAKFILANGDSSITCGNYEMNNTEGSDLNKAIKAAKAYGEKAKNFGIAIESMVLNGNNVDVTVSGTFDSWNIYINDSETVYATQTSADKTISIPLTSFTGNEAKVAVSANMNKYEASFYLLKSGKWQRLLIIDAKGTSDVTTDKVPEEIVLNTNVSLEKYITEVNGESLEHIYANGNTNIVNQSGLSGSTWHDKMLIRFTKKATSGSNKNISSINSNWNVTGKYDTNSNYYKQNKPVNIQVGDVVTYRIYVYNNSTIEATNIEVTDTLPPCADKYCINGDNPNIDVPSDKKFIHTIGSLAGGNYTYFDVKVRFSEFSASLLTNAAQITDCTPDNASDSDYRTMDADYVKMADTNVSLQKYITKVNNTAVSSRANRKATTNTTNAIWKNITNSTGTNKDSDVVQIEAGDVVTYRIHVYNNSNIKALEVNVEDTLPDYADEYRVNGEGEWQIIPSNKKFTHTIVNLEGGSSTYFDVEVHFNVYTENTLENKAKISTTTPNNNTTYRIEDSDYVKMKKYSVSLEKYVTEVTDAFGNNSVTYDREGYRYNEGISNRYDQYENDNKNPYKQKNRVEIEAGDFVTFTIKLTNTGETYTKVTKIYDVFTHFKNDVEDEYKGLQLVYDSAHGIQGNGGGKIVDYDYAGYNDYRCRRYLMEFENAELLEPGKSTYVTIKFKVSIPRNLTNISIPKREIYTDENLPNRDDWWMTFHDLYNKAGIVEIQNRNNIKVSDSDGTDNNYDNDYLINKFYQVSLEKYVSKVNGEELKDINANVKQRAGKPEHNNDNDTKTHNSWKHNNVVTVGQNDLVTYTIIVRNDSTDTSVKVSKVIDILPAGVEYVSVSGDYKKSNEKDKLSFEAVNNDLIVPGGSRTFEITVKVTESNMSVDILQNIASIDEESLSNRNEVPVRDLTGNNNSDADYIQMKDIIISGVVWNDRAFDKNASEYNGIYDYKDNKETALSGIKVYLYRVFNNKVTLEKETTTNTEGKYIFALDYMKAPKNSDNNRWNDNKKYYSYYVVFEYDGVKYTPTGFADVTSDNAYDSNAKEDNSEGKSNLPTREAFNKKFNPINNSSISEDKTIEYETINEQGFIPQSRYVYNSEIMGMKASTNYIGLSNNANLESDLTHINLGLRGRDTFDLELTADVYSTKVSVNGVEGEYSYGNNIVTVRNTDIIAKDNQSIIGEDSANISQETIESSISRVNQDIRKTDIKNEKYDNTRLEIEVTYKLTVKNPSKTDGTATKVIDYYDDKYTFIKAYDEDVNPLNVVNGESGEGFKSIIITTHKKRLSQNVNSNTMDIYVVYKLNDATNTLSSLLTGTTEIPTFNMAEIVEYETYCAQNQTDYTRGLIDIDSMPGSANKEQARLMSTVGQKTPTKNGTPTTVEYYFGGNDLTQLKYEDDTYTTPTLYFTSSDNQRTIIGTVFRDNTTTDETTRIKTGNGKLDEGEEPVYGALVFLIENTEEGIRQRYWTTTNEYGVYEFKGFLPGNYIIDYLYGNSLECVLLNQAENVNKYSYNGEDYQSTNNTGSYGASKLAVEERPNYWYLDNETEGVSIATDSVSRRNDVSNNVTKFIDEEMQVLNKMREGKNKEEAKVTYTTSEGQKTITVNNIIDKTWMNAETQNMLFSVEKAYINNNEVKQASEFGEYIISNMNFGIAEVPVTTIDLQKHVKEFSITDATGSNIIASMKYEDGKWKLKGDVIPSIEGTNNIDVSIEEDKLQGARLEITYEITANMSTEKNFDNKSFTVPTIKGIVDYISNSLSYNENLGDNSKYWELTTYDEIKDIYAAQKWEDGTTPQGTADAEGKQYTTIVKAKANNPLLLTTEGTGAATITLEKVLSSTDSTIEEIITSTVDSFEYSNLIEITGLDYGNVTPDDSDPDDNDTPDNSEPEGTQPQRDRIRTPDRYIIVPGVHHDTITSETLVIHPPTGDSSINIVYYVIALISLVILAVSVFGIKKFVVNTKR